MSHLNLNQANETAFATNFTFLFLSDYNTDIQRVKIPWELIDCKSLNLIFFFKATLSTTVP